jgi:hypothetical protein
MRHEFKTLFGNLEGKGQLGRHKHTRKDNIKVDLTKIVLTGFM